MTTFLCRGRPAAAVCLALLLAAGCETSGMPAAGVVRGTVTYKGQPVPAGSVVFYPDGVSGREAAAQIGADGGYVVYEAPIGATLVVVRGVDAKTASAGMYPGQTIPKGAVVTGAPAEARMGSAPPAKPVILPAKYAKPESTPLHFKVKGGDGSRFDIELID